MQPPGSAGPAVTSVAAAVPAFLPEALLGLAADAPEITTAVAAMTGHQHRLGA